MLAGPIDGLESTVNLQNLKCYSPRSSMLGEPAAGDFNGDGSVDKLDLAVRGRQFGQVASGLSADDGDVDGTDFLTWQRQLGSGSPTTASSAVVPEPATLATLLLGVLLLSSKRRGALDEGHKPWRTDPQWVR